MPTVKIKERYYLFTDELGEYFVVMDENKAHAIETAKDWFRGKITFQCQVDEEYADRHGLDIY